MRILHIIINFFLLGIPSFGNVYINPQKLFGTLGALKLTRKKKKVKKYPGQLITVML